ncbi:MAG: gluconate 2-dehydrogenase subunit 3 family protein [Akkermansiaceae bacterium]
MMKLIATTVGGSMALPESAFAKLGEPFDPREQTFFRPAQRKQVAMIAEAIIPKTDTPGAIEAGVPGWIEVIVKDCYEADQQKVITDGLSDLMRRCQEQYGTDISALSANDQVAFLTKYQAATRAERSKRVKKHGWQPPAFIDQFKDLVKLCYCGSEVGATQALEYLPVPGKWIADMPLKPDQKVWAT